jgi:hypothetical protein
MSANHCRRDQVPMLSSIMRPSHLGATRPLRRKKRRFGTIVIIRHVMHPYSMRRERNTLSHRRSPSSVR